MRRKINFSWKNILIICFFCEKTEHFKRNCPNLKEARNNQNLLEELKEAAKEIEITTISNNKNNSIKEHSDNRSPPEIVLSKDIENNIFLDTSNNLSENNSTHTELYINITSTQKEKPINITISDSDNDTPVPDEQESDDMQTDDNSKDFIKVTSKRRNRQTNSPNIESTRATRHRKGKKQCKLEPIRGEKISKK